MRTRVLVLAAILLVFLQFSQLAEAQFSYQETDRIALNVSVFDPDSDAIRIAYSSPLNEKGEWQTTYGDAGVYRINVTVSDGTLSSTEEVVMVVNRKDEPPQITAQRPRAGMISMREGKTLTFSSKASDKNNDAIEYVWALDGMNISRGERFTYAPGYDEEGDHAIVLYITDGTLTTVRNWDVAVRDVDLDTLIMSQYRDITVNENDLVRIPLPDTAYYGIQYSISNPLENGYWKTDFNSSGAYKVSIRVFGKGYDETKTLLVRVLNVDQRPIISPISSKSVEEGKELSFLVKATDPDGDKVSLSLKNAPEGATLSNEVFKWTPSYDVANPTGITTRIARSVHLLSATFELEFVASAKNQSAVVMVPLTVFNTNRPPVLVRPSSLIVREGDLFQFDANASDPDGDRLEYSFESTLKRGSIIGYDQAGTHMLKVMVSDGFLQDEMFIPIIVENTNRAPALTVPSQRIAENKTLIIELQGKDEDNDPLTYSIASGPKGMKIVGSILSWTPEFDVTSSDPQSIIANISVSDGQSKTMAPISIEVKNTNRAPMLSEPPIQTLTAQKGRPLTLHLNVTDPDGDRVSYTWRFGWFDSYKGDSEHIRTFVTKGQKTITVKASDGIGSVKKKIIVTVV